MISILPQMALYYNKWNKLENREVCKLFDLQDFDQVAHLQPGEDFWFNQDPIYHQGKVYGYVRKRVVSVEIVDDDTLRLHFTSGMTTIYRDRPTKVYTLTDAEALTALVTQDYRIGNTSRFST